MKVYITVETGKNPRILNVYVSENEAIKQARIYSVAFRVWVNVVEKEVVK
jgi:hypothetical protein